MTGWMRPDLFEQRADLALEPLLRAADGFRGQPRGRGVVVRRRHELRVPARGERADQPRQAPELLVLLQAVERFEHGQVGFAAGQPLGAAAASDPHRLAALLELPHERLDERRLADAGFAGDRRRGAPCRAARARTRGSSRRAPARARPRSPASARGRAETVTDDSAVAMFESCASASRYITSRAPGRSRPSFCSISRIS